MTYVHIDPSTADLSNWRMTPHSRWAFRNVREIIPCAIVEAAGGGASSLPAAPRSFDAFSLPASGGRRLGLADFLRVTATDAFVILHEGKIAHEYYDHGNGPHTPHIIMSATKAVTGLVAGLLQHDGVLDVEAPVRRYVPEIANTAYRTATVRHLLDMRAGVRLDDEAQRAYDAATNWFPLLAGRRPAGLHRFFESLAATERGHGGPFGYVSANTDLLGWVLERAAGRSFASLLSALLWKPMGAESDAYITLDCEGAPRCTGGFCATVRDLARLGQLVVDGGRRGSRQVVPGAWIADVESNGNREAWRSGEFAASFGQRDMSYRNGWYVVHDAPGTLFAMGIYGQNLFIDRANRLVIAKMSSQANPLDADAIALTHMAVAEIRRCVLARA
jgi:CubicO group peptidase (beta-lactamase class C family)